MRVLELMFRPASLIFALFTGLSLLAQSPVPANGSAASGPPPQLRSLVTRALGSGAEIIRYGHLSTPDSVEAIGAVLAVGIPNSPGGNAVSRLALLRQEGNQWISALFVNNRIRNNDGEITESSERSSLYRVAFFEHRFDDGRERWIMQFTPINQTGEPNGRPIHVSWNEMLSRYQQISMEGYGFQPEFHGEASD